jgi:hypothetical protein
MSSIPGNSYPFNFSIAISNASTNSLLTHFNHRTATKDTQTTDISRDILN